MKNFFNSFWFNAIIASIAGFFGIMQEVWLGTDIVVINAITFSVIASFCMSLGASVIGFLATGEKLNWKNVGIGTVVGIIVAIVTLLVAC